MPFSLLLDSFVILFEFPGLLKTIGSFSSAPLVFQGTRAYFPQLHMNWTSDSICRYPALE
jgi:hypothetical protein